LYSKFQQGASKIGVKIISGKLIAVPTDKRNDVMLYNKVRGGSETIAHLVQHN